eukprot:316669-Chlamydomonas_euryale.AAC.1
MAAMHSPGGCAWQRCTSLGDVHGRDALVLRMCMAAVHFPWGCVHGRDALTWRICMAAMHSP